MPQITCPNCGMTINLENRRGIDFDLITPAVKKRPRTFTELLHITKLSRKTLSLRLKKLRENGILVKGEGVYKLNGDFEYENIGRDFVKGFSRVFHNKRMRTGLMLVALLMFLPVSGYVLAMFLVPPPHEATTQEPIIKGNFMMALSVNDVKDLYAWQVIITFDSSKLEAMKVTPGDFVGFGFPFFVNATDVGRGILLLGGTLCGSVPGKNGSGRLANITFRYYADEYEWPKITQQIRSFETQLWDSKGSPILRSNSTVLTLTIFED